MKKQISLIALLTLLHFGLYAQGTITINEVAKVDKKECSAPTYKKSGDLEEAIVYINSDRETPKGYKDIYVMNYENCESEKKGKLKLFWDGNADYGFLVSPSKKLAMVMEYSLPNYSAPKFMGVHVLNESGELVWEEEWGLKSGDTELEMISAGVDDKGNALFFVKAKSKEGTAYAIAYRAISNGEYKVISYKLDVNGRVTFRTNFDQWGNIHFMGAFSRTDTKQTGEVKRGIFHGKVDPTSEATLETTLYPFEEVGRFESNWKLKEYFIDDDGNITFCAMGQYAKSGAGRDFSKLFIIQLDKDGETKWSHVISTVNLLREPALSEGDFFKLGNSYAYIYYDNNEYIKYTDGFDPKEINSEPKLNEMQMYLINEKGELSKLVIGPKEFFSKYSFFDVENDGDALVIKGKNQDIRITW